MANTDIARGLVPVSYRNGAPYNGAANVYYVPASDGTALFTGDPVAPVNAGSETKGIPTVTRATAAGGNYLMGSVVGIVSHGDPAVTVQFSTVNYRAASTEMYVLVADDPNLLFEIQEDGVGGAMGVGAPSRNVDMVAGTGSTATGWSGFELDSSTLDTTNTLQFRIHRPVDRVDNDSTLTNAKWLVSINLHHFNYTTGI